jgi:hypothetical protein
MTAAQRFTNRRQQLGGHGILEHVRGCVMTKSLACESGIAMLGKEDDLDLGMPPRELTRSVEPVEYRHFDISDDDIRVEYVGGTKQCATVRRRPHNVELPTQYAVDDFEKSLMIVGDEDARFRHTLRSADLSSQRVPLGASPEIFGDATSRAIYCW